MDMFCVVGTVKQTEQPNYLAEDSMIVEPRPQAPASARNVSCRHHCKSAWFVFQALGQQLVPIAFVWLLLFKSLKLYKL
eukprot:1159929-Pelagomonas_calceolata.AAC.27